MSVSAAASLPRTIHLIEQGISERQQPGVQLYVSHRGQVVADIALGENEPDVPLTTDHWMLWLSAGKPITAVAFLRHVESGEFDLDQPVAEVIPEFAQNGKERVTPWHLLTHTVGLRPILTGWPQRSWDEIIEKVCQSPLQRDWEPGKRAAYDPGRSWFILGEMLQRVTGKPIEQVVQDEILTPLEMNQSRMAMPTEVWENSALRIGRNYNVKEGEFTPTHSHERLACTRPSPGASMRGPIRELGRFYEMLLRGGTSPAGETILQPETISAMTSRQREGLLDESFQHQVDFGLGLIVNSNRYGAETIPYGFGRFAGESSFGHGGAQSSIGFADPENQVVVSMVANGLPGDKQHDQRFRDYNSAIYEDLGLTRQH
ncbi:serine hydrolase domain-containing protein [Planctomicrobium sp. SH664]|uniref:serine hydrolase domain-containing protein n=1 Tax=Planctomicrobium sp. SH664 TaxID=3448125 RepID=UPI003F5BFA30